MTRLSGLRVAGERCSRATTPRNRCSRCADACPRDAVRLGRGPEVLPSCDGCGVCVGACPSDVFEHASFDERAMLERLATSGEPRRIACREVPESVEAPVRLECLGALTVPLLVGAGPGAIELWRGGCATCPLSRALVAGRRAIDAARKLSRALGRPVDLELHTSEERRAPSSTGGLSRRGLFGLLRDRLTPPKPEGRPRRGGRALLVEQLDAAKATSATVPEAGLMAIDVSEACTGCRVCTDVCAARAIRREQTERHVTLSFNRFRCTGCASCVDCCLPRAIALRPAPLGSFAGYGTPRAADTALAEAFEPVVRRPMRTCRRCRAVFGGDSDLCAVCRTPRSGLLAAFDEEASTT